MLLIFNKELNENKIILTELMQLYGLNTYWSIYICNLFGLNYFQKLNQIPNNILTNLILFIENNFDKEEVLKNEKFENIEFLKILKTYKGIRHIFNLPVRGQQTHRNAKTQKYKRPVPIKKKK